MMRKRTYPESQQPPTQCLTLLSGRCVGRSEIPARQPKTFRSAPVTLFRYRIGTPSNAARLIMKCTQMLAMYPSAMAQLHLRCAAKVYTPRA